MNNQETINAINNSFSSIDNYINSDENLIKNRSFLEKELYKYSKTFEKLIKTNQGIRKIHYIDYDGSQIPLRLLSVKEEIEIKHATHKEFKNFPEFIGGEDHPLFNKIELIKTLSRATTISPELINDPYLSENEVMELPSVAFIYLINEYNKLNQEYNIAYNPTIDEDLTYIINAIFDGAPLNEKKLSLLNGLTSSMRLQIILRLCNALMLLEENTQFITLLNESMTQIPKEV